MSRYHVIVFLRTKVQDHDPFVGIRMLGISCVSGKHWVTAPDMEVISVCESREHAITLAELVSLERCIPFHRPPND